MVSSSPSVVSLDKAKNVLESLSKHILVDGYHMVMDLRASRGNFIHDSLQGVEILDFFSHFATCPIGYAHPKLTTPEFLDELAWTAVTKPANSDIYTEQMASFVETFARLGVPSTHSSHMFFVEGGALANENALKAAFDWKVRRNFKKGYRREVGSKILHFEQAFHGRSGYTLSLTNTADPRKHIYFAKFDWPRITNPKLRFPVTRQVLAEVMAAEQQAVAEIEQAVRNNRDDIAALIIEPIQGEGGDNHFRPEFFANLRRLADEHEFMFIVDEVQTGLGGTGKMWAIEHMGVKPDIIAFGKKTQVCGIIAGKRVDEVPENVFHVSSRINSTWGGNLVDMVRSQRYLEIIQEECLVENAAQVGQILLDGVTQLAEGSDLLDNPRGRGLMVAFDLPDALTRDIFRGLLLENGLLALKCGERSIRFRPMLDLPPAAAEEALAIVDRSLYDARHSSGQL